ncbi:MAG TPA: histidine phosphatase family protein [Candidatus Paceibacterota bacterium]|nr:histidine phosphatase family protein [Candidatus Paceibacterota bacterium]
MKKVYFIRHGESEGNAGPIRQTKETPLTKKGKSQASIVAERCVKLPLEFIVCSSMNRAKETAEIILGKISKPIEYSDLFIERRRPSEVLGKPKNDPAALEAEKEIEEKFQIPGFKFSDEENFEDLKRRAKKALEYLERRPEETILVVTHGFFMRIIMAYVVFGDKLTGEECVRFIQKFHMENTGITVLGYDGKSNSPWWLWIWNDHAHLD